jgi:hypothetical protein
MAVAPSLEHDMSPRRTLAALLAMLPGIAAAEFHVVIIEGLGGDDSYHEQFADQVDAIERATSSLDASVTVFHDGDYSRADVKEHFRALAAEVGRDDRVALFLIGHGSYDDHEYKFNIAGPDLTGADLVDMLGALDSTNQLLVDTSSASGATYELLKADNRSLILATRSGSERHATRFGHYFVVALGDASADLDKNQMVTAEEAFEFAARQVADYFERNGQLATEHPRIEGSQVARFSLSRLGGARPVVADSALQRLVESRERLNADIEELRLRRDSMPAEDYQSELLPMMLELATIEEQIEQRETELGNED